MASLPILGVDAGSPSVAVSSGTPAPGSRPAWLRVQAPGSGKTSELRQLLAERRLHTVCSSAACPNMGDCWSAGTATFMILGNECTRACRFCDVKTAAQPNAVDLDEPERLAEAAVLMGLKHVVITSVARDDLDDGGARHFARCLRAVRARLPAATLEVLVPDFLGSEDSIATVLEALLESGAASPKKGAVFNHNVETCERLTPKIRSGAVYRRSLVLLQTAKRMRPDVRTKTGMMLGLGETDDEIVQTIRDARAHDVDILTLGQYLRPSSWNHEVVRYVSPQQFTELGAFARTLGFAHVESGPLVRSSYHAERGVSAG
ncbi:MAG: lipoyl synthase [Deltaproteobacteria bacterium]|nr:lipoyl synthase [Deltaproteobacteria bacterium]